MGSEKVIKVLKPRLIFVSSDAPIHSRWSDYSALNHALEAGKKDLANILLKGHCRVNSNSNTPSDTPLHKAIKLGDAELITKLLSKGASVTAFDPEGNTPLHLAFLLKQTEVVRCLLAFNTKRKVYTNPKNKQGLTHLHVASTQSDQEIVQGLLDAGANIQDAVNKDSPHWPDFTAMHFAIEFKREETAHTLVQAAKKSAREKLDDALLLDYVFHQRNDKDEYGFCRQLSNFHVACTRDNPNTMRRYIEFGAALNLPLSEGVTLCPLYLPLHLAVEGNCKRNVEVLLECGAIADLCNSLRMTPLHLAFYHGRDEIVKLLWDAVKENLTINRKDCYLLSYMHVAVARNELDVVKTFCDSGEDVNARVLRNDKNYSGYSPLHFALVCVRLEMAELLIDRGADVSVGTPMHLAVETGDKALVELLLRSGTKVEVRDEDERTALHLLVMKNVEEMLEYVEKFVELGCDVDAKDSDGNTALHLARGSRFAKVLLDFGADVNVKNNEGRTPLMEARDCEVLITHVRKLKAIGAKVCSSNEVKGDSRVDRRMKEEVEKMRNVRLSGCMTILDFLLLEPSLAYAYVEDEALMSIVEDEGLTKEYPMYGYLIKLQFRRGIEHSKRMRRSSSVEIGTKRRRCE